MKKLLITAAALSLFSISHVVSAQPPGGQGGFTPPKFEDYDTDNDGKIVMDEYTAFMQKRMANMPQGMGRGPGAQGQGQENGQGGQNMMAMMFGRWDSDSDGSVSKEEFDARPRMGPGMGPGMGQGMGQGQRQGSPGAKPDQ